MAGKQLVGKIKKNQSQIEVASEIGRLRKVFLHTPGKEVELMTPNRAGELLYNDIIYSKNIVKGHNELKSVLSLVSKVFEVSSCLEEVLHNPQARDELLDSILNYQGRGQLKPELAQLSSKDLSDLLITGMPLKRDTLESWLSPKSFDLVPLPNMYFMRDTSVVIGNHVVTGHMANSIRFNESMIMNTIYNYHPELKGLGVLLPKQSKENAPHDPQFTLEGGDVLIVNKNLLLIGVSQRTTPRAVDALIRSVLNSRKDDEHPKPLDVICVLLPHERSTIHLDMIFTIANQHQALIYHPYVLGRAKAQVIHIHVKLNGEKEFKDKEDIFSALKSVGVKMEPILCGGTNPLHQQREQWNSGANVFSFAPGKIISYVHEHTLKSCEAAGFKIVRAKDVIKHPALIQNSSAMVVTVDGSELSRGGGGPRCMTCPIFRDPI